MTIRHGRSAISSAFICTATAAVLLLAFPHGVVAATGDPKHDPAADTAPCEIAAKAGDDARIIEACTRLIAVDDVPRSDRIAALNARGGAYARTGELDHAIEDYNTVIRFEPKQLDARVARGRLWRVKGDRRAALDDFAAALRIDSRHAVRSEFKSLAQELEREGALAAINNRPSFDCGKARRPVEKAICADPVLMRLDREIGILNDKLLATNKPNRPVMRALQKASEAYLTARNQDFGKSGFDLKQTLQARRDHMQGQLAEPAASSAGRNSP